MHCHKALHIWGWGHFALPKSPSYMAMGTLCTAKKPLIYGDGDGSHCQKAPHIWRWGHFALPKCPSYMAMGTLSGAGLLGERMGRAGGASGPNGRLMSAEYAGAGPAGALSRPSSMTWGWLPDSQLLPSPSPLPSRNSLGTGSEPLPVYKLYNKEPLGGHRQPWALPCTGHVPLPHDSPPVVARLPVFFNTAGLMLLSMGFPPSVLTCGDVEPNPGPRAHSCTIWAVLLTHLLTSLPPPLVG